jgi:uncharacterized membrane-anchored protein
VASSRFVPAGLTRRLEEPTERKVPLVTVWFWVVKILTTAAGEAISDYAVHRFDPVVAVLVGFAAFVAVLTAQLVVGRYIAALYWGAASMVAVFGTMTADVLHVRLGVSYAASFSGFALALVVVFIVWERAEHTLSIHDINSRRREIFYWATVLVTFALGTATGDLTAYSSGWGFLASAVVFTVAFIVPGIAYRLRVMNGVAAFWTAYIVTRPLGASYADWLGTPHDIGGLNLGRGTVSVTLASIIVALVWMLTATELDIGTVQYRGASLSTAAERPRDEPRPPKDL